MVIISTTIFFENLVRIWVYYIYLQVLKGKQF